MSKPLVVSFFSSPSPEGIILQKAVEQLITNLGFKLKMLPHPTLANVASACWHDDVVIFDGSIEDGGHDYTITFEPLKGMRHVFVVSRTPLPLNFFGLRTEGFPDYPKGKSNEAILAWLAQELPLMQPRPWSEKGLLLQAVAQTRSIDWQTKRRKRQGQIFISYRSRYGKDVQELQKRLQKGEFHQGEPKSMFFFPAGSLAFEDEVMSAMRRWQVLSIIRDYIYDCEEFWLYETNDYLDSWWTRGELATLVYGTAGKRVVVYNADSKTTRDASLTELPLQTKEEHNRMARWFANTDPMTMGAESTIILGEVAQTPLGQLPFFNDPVWKEKFQHYPIIQCSSEACNKKRIRQETGSFQFDMNGLLWMIEDNLFPIESWQLEQVVEERKTVTCPRCGTVYHIEREPLDRYLYLALPVGTGPRGKNLQSLPVYRASPSARGKLSR